MNSLMILKNYLKIGLRRFSRHRLYAGINVAGLAIGLCVSMFILLYVWEEMNYDNFHQDSEQVYRVTRQYKEVAPSSTTPWPAARLLREQLAEVEYSTRVLKYWFDPVLSIGEKSYYESDAYFVDEHFFEVFDYPLLKGDPKTAFATANSILIDQQMAEKYFGDEDPIGKTITYNAKTNFEVRGVIAPLPGNSHFQFRYLLFSKDLSDLIEMPLEGNWDFSGFHTYLKTRQESTPEAMTKLITAQVQANSTDQANYGLQPLQSIHLHSDLGGELQANSDIRFIWLLLAIALVILSLAAVNYTNLSVSMFAKQKREIGVRKVIGAQQSQLLSQFLVQSVLMSVSAFLVAVFLFQALLPSVRNFINQQLYLTPTQHLLFLGLMLLLAITLGLLSGIYPSRQSIKQPLQLVKGEKVFKVNRTPLWKWLVGIQFMLAILLLFNTFLVQDQLAFLQSKQLGFEEERVLVIPVREKALAEKPDLVKAQLKTDPSVLQVSSSATLPGVRIPATTIAPIEASGKSEFKANMFFVDDTFVPTMDMELAAGQNFSNNDDQADQTPILINEAMAEAMGWENPAAAVGSSIDFWGSKHPVKGVVQNFHYETARKAIAPLLIMPDMQNCDGLIVRLGAGNLNDQINNLQGTWKEIAQEQPFTFYFLDDRLGQFYKAEQKYSRIMKGASFLSILIACLGLFGLAAFATEKRIKEIGIRKVLGAAPSQLVWLFNREFLKVVLVAILLSAPLSWWIAQQWLNYFAYPVPISWGIFLFAAFGAIAIAFFTVSLQSLKAATQNPVNAIKKV